MSCDFNHNLNYPDCLVWVFLKYPNKKKKKNQISKIIEFKKNLLNYGGEQFSDSREVFRGKTK